jgi:trehalose/maltose transport system substrate-binding protein
LVRFLGSREVQFRRSLEFTEPPTLPELYHDPRVLAANPYFSHVLETYRSGVTLRPSKQAGTRYPDVSRAYFEAVHAVLTGKKTAAEAAADLEGVLLHITGLQTPATGASAHGGQDTAASPR